MEFYKLQATGNDFIITFNNSFDFNIKEICKRKYGIGADGFINIDENNNILFFSIGYF